MSNRLVEISKDGNNYTVNPNATPSGGSVTAYGFQGLYQNIYLPFDVVPDDITVDFNVCYRTMEDIVCTSLADYIKYDQGNSNEILSITKEDDTAFSMEITPNGGSTVYTKYIVRLNPPKDFTLWGN